MKLKFLNANFKSQWRDMVGADIPSPRIELLNHGILSMATSEEVVQSEVADHDVYRGG